jgi:hypothetical protein
MFGGEVTPHLSARDMMEVQGKIKRKLLKDNGSHL